MKKTFLVKLGGNDTVIPGYQNWREVILNLDSQGELCSCPCPANPGAKESYGSRGHLKT